MDATENGTTSLEGLARRLETLERENAELRGKVAVLEGSSGRAEVEAPRGPESRPPQEEPSSEPSGELAEGRISRRGLLGKVGAAAAGLVVAGALTQRDIRQAKAAIAETSNSATVPAVKGTNTFGGVGVRGEGLYGVEGHSDGATGQGVHGINSKAGDGVLGDSQGGAAIRGRSFVSTGVGVHGEHFGGGGYGGQFKGGRAQLRLVPGNTEGRPGGAHSKGEIYMGLKGALFVCVQGGTPGKWRKVSTTAV